MSRAAVIVIAIGAVPPVWLALLALLALGVV